MNKFYKIFLLLTLFSCTHTDNNGLLGIWKLYSKESDAKTIDITSNHIRMNFEELSSPQYKYYYKNDTIQLFFPATNNHGIIKDSFNILLFKVDHYNRDSVRLHNDSTNWTLKRL